MYAGGSLVATYEAVSEANGAPVYNGCTGYEGHPCDFSGTRTVAFGANGSFLYGTFTGGVDCTPANFGGDPAPNTPSPGEACYGSAGVAPAGPIGSVFCAAEGQTCSISGSAEVAFGANASYFFQVVSGSVTCSTAVFGDPAPGIAKNCFSVPMAVHFRLTDWLGTMRAQTDYSGKLEQTCSSLPFGDAQTCAMSTPVATEQFFTGKERDTESGLDYFGARYYGSNMGRFLSPDYSDGPDAVPFGDLGNPQSLNLYGYVQNNPLNSIDEDGHLDCSGGATQDVACAVTAAAKAVWHWLSSGGDNSSVTTSQTIDIPAPAPPPVPEGAPGTATGPLMQAQQDARNNPSFQPIPGGSTFCNMASCYIGNHVPGTNMDPLMTNGIPNLANTDYNTLAHSGSYHQVGPAEAQRLANLGKVVFGVYKETGHGHIVTVAPDNTYFGQAYFPNHSGTDPLINDIGRHIGVYPLSQQPSAGFRAGVIFYAQN